MALHNSDRVSPEDSKKLKEYGKATVLYSDYDRDPRWTLGVPSAINILVLLPLVLAKLCSSKIISTTTGLYSSMVLWVLNLSGFIFIQNMISSYNMVTFFNSHYLILIAFQLSTLIILTFQVLISAWELRRQKAQWPVFKISNILTLNTVFLITRIALGVVMINVFRYSSMWNGATDPKYEMLLSYNWYNPRIKLPEYLVYPVLVALTYNVVVSIENVLSHLLGHLHKNMMSFTASVATLFYGGVIFGTSPIYLGMVFAVSPSPETMNFAVGLMFLCLIHAILSVAKPSLMNGYFPLDALLSNSQLHPSLVYSADDIKTRVAALRNKFRGSDTLLYNTIATVLSGLAVILAICNEVWWWAGMVMVCGNVAILNRLLPALIVETMFQKGENTPILKELMHIVLECVLLLIGVIGSFSWFYGAMAAAIIINILLILSQIYRFCKLRAMQASVRSLNTDLANQPKSGLLVDNLEPGDEEEATKVH
ncbi:uncharacterized protein LOC135216474 [Macrobrachium nipponense]|uniref:uncharacterized protein LOC135216474 n=1 Tax=Macrobrachium nipponense TaxID=159736 RepID=UPI0030C7F6F8